MTGRTAEATKRRVAVTLEQCWHRVPGGTATSILALVDALAGRDDVEVQGVAAWHRRVPPAPFVPAVPVSMLPLPRLALYEAWHGLRAPAVQRATGPVDVIHATAVAVPPKTAPLVITVHDLAFLADASHATRHGHRFFRRGLSLARRHADLVLCPSAATAAECEAAGFDRDRLRVVPWGVRRAEVTPAQVATVRRRHRLSERYVMFTGTLEPRKNLAGLVDAFASIATAHPCVELVLIGPDGWNEDLAGRLRRANLEARAKPLGFVPDADKWALYAGAAVFCYPSHREGFGLPVLEAMAQGAPVVTSAGTATEEVAGGAGLLVEPRDTPAIANALSQVLDDAELATDLSRRGRERAAAFTWEAAADATAAAYAELSP